MWEFSYLMSVYFQFINSSAVYTVTAGVQATGLVLKSDMDALFAFTVLSNIFAFLVVLFSSFCRTRFLVFPCMLIGLVWYLITMSIQTHVMSLASIATSTHWQYPIGWAALVLKFITLACVSLWDKNESEDKYASTGYCGRVPVFPISRAAIYMAGILQILGARGFVLQAFIVDTTTTEWTAYHALTIVGAVFTFLGALCVVVKPQKALTILVAMLCFGMAIGQGVTGQGLHDNNAATTLSAAVQNLTWDWVTGYSWSAMVFYFIGFVCSIARSD